MTTERAPRGRYLLDFDTRELPRIETDVLVVGAGVAGLSAALAAAGAGGRVLLVLKDRAGASNTAWAQGGMAAAVDADDSIEDHIADTLRTGCGLCDTGVVRAVAQTAPAAVERLVSLGVRFDQALGGGYELGREGGHGHRRILHTGDATGAEFNRALFEAVCDTPTIRLEARRFMVDLLTAGSRCVGAILTDRNAQDHAVFAGSVVLAAGGAGRLFRETTNVRGATGDGIAAAYRAGAELRDLEFVQFHPTTLYLAGSQRVLVTEAVRGEGAWLIDNLGERFLPAVHPDAELAPRDVVSRAIVQHLGEPGVTDVYLDLRHWEPGLARRRFPGLATTCARYGLDPERDPIPVRPAAHYFIGGVACDLDGRTSLDGLLVCGEVAATGLHGANRLASNSLLEGLVLGSRVGATAGEARVRPHAEPIVHETGRDREFVDLDDLRESLTHRMWRSGGILRDGLGLREACEAIERWRRFSSHVRLHGRAGFEIENLLLLGSLVANAALLREESRGTHARLDFPERDDARFQGSFYWRTGAKPVFRHLETAPLG